MPSNAPKPMYMSIKREVVEALIAIVEPIDDLTPQEKATLDSARESLRA